MFEMKKLFFLLSIFQLILTAQEVNLKLIVNTSSVSATDTIFIAGSHPLLGNWNPHKINLEKINDTTWSKTFLLPSKVEYEFKFTLGGWNREALNSDSSKPSNNQVNLSGDTTIVYNISKWADFKNLFQGEITGLVKYHRNLEYPGLKPRDAIVWLPPKYFADKAKHYPVLYMHDGQNIIDPKTSFSGIDWQVDETVDSLIRNKIIKEIIIVGIYNTTDRSAEYSDTDLGSKYRDFIINKLKPLIDTTYRTLRDKNNTATMGSSMGGLVAFILGWEFPDIFGLAAPFSPAIRIMPYNYLKKVTEYSGPKKDVKFYFYNGGIDIEAKLQPGIDEVIFYLTNNGYEKGKDFEVKIDPTLPHTEAAWALNVAEALKFLFPVD
ncbi:MAG: histidine kinase [Ignavibacteriales bacterium]|nr:MAG: histidine kinase [Ignavibacteriales bacterium]